MKLIIEIFIIWLLFFIYVYSFTIKTGPVGAIFWYPLKVQKLAVKRKLITEKRLNKRKKIAYLCMLLIIPVYFIMVVVINKQTDFLAIWWQTCVLYIAMETFDCIVIDTLWVAKTKFWDIKELYDHKDLWHNYKPKLYRKLPLQTLLSVPLSLILSAIFYPLGAIL